jgi:hypothetical protein
MTDLTSSLARLLEGLRALPARWASQLTRLLYAQPCTGALFQECTLDGDILTLGQAYLAQAGWSFGDRVIPSASSPHLLVLSRSPSPTQGVPLLPNLWGVVRLSLTALGAALPAGQWITERTCICLPPAPHSRLAIVDPDWRKVQYTPSRAYFDSLPDPWIGTYQISRRWFTSSRRQAFFGAGRVRRALERFYQQPEPEDAADCIRCWWGDSAALAQLLAEVYAFGHPDYPERILLPYTPF